jgi:hypothetical protein
MLGVVVPPIVKQRPESDFIELSRGEVLALSDFGLALPVTVFSEFD